MSNLKLANGPEFNRIEISSSLHNESISTKMAPPDTSFVEITVFKKFLLSTRIFNESFEK